MQPTPNEILWLNLTNAGLGLATLGGIVALGWAAVRELRERAKGRVAVHDLDPHAAFIPELGLTMADGGEKLAEKTEEKK